MPDLSTLDETQPPGTQAVGFGDDRIRETRMAVKTSFNVEHVLTGAHAFRIGVQGARPAPGTVGRIFFNLTNGCLEMDNGSTWVLAGMQRLNGFATAGAFGLSPVGTWLNVVVGVVAVPGSANMSIRCNSGIIVSGGHPYGIAARVMVDNVLPLFPSTGRFYTGNVDSNLFTINIEAVAPLLAAGNHTFAFQVNNAINPVTVATANDSTMAVTAFGI